MRVDGQDCLGSGAGLDEGRTESDAVNVRGVSLGDRKAGQEGSAQASESVSLALFPRDIVGEATEC